MSASGLRDLGISGGGRVGGGRRWAGRRGSEECAAKARSLRLTADVAWDRKREDNFGKETSSRRASSGFGGKAGADAGNAGLNDRGSSCGFGEVGRGGGKRRGLSLQLEYAGVDGRREGIDIDEGFGNAFERGDDNGGTGDIGGVDKGGIGDGDKIGARAKDGLGGNGGGASFEGERVIDEEAAAGLSRERGSRMTELDWPSDAEPDTAESLSSPKTPGASWRRARDTIDAN